MNIIKTDQISILFIKLFIMLINISKLQELIKNIDEKYPWFVPTLIYVVKLLFCQLCECNGLKRCRKRKAKSFLWGSHFRQSAVVERESKSFELCLMSTNDNTIFINRYIFKMSVNSGFLWVKLSYKTVQDC